MGYKHKTFDHCDSCGKEEYLRSAWDLTGDSAWCDEDWCDECGEKYEKEGEEREKDELMEELMELANEVKIVDKYLGKKLKKKLKELEQHM